jgi:hypothetical protein
MGAVQVEAEEEETTAVTRTHIEKSIREGIIFLSCH